MGNTTRMRHKHIATYPGEWDIFEYLVDNKMVKYRYNYTGDTIGGKIYSVNKGKDISIATNIITRERYYDKRSYARFYYRRLMLVLNEEGLSYLKGQIMELNI